MTNIIFNDKDPADNLKKLKVEVSSVCKCLLRTMCCKFLKINAEYESSLDYKNTNFAKYLLE